MKAFDDATIAFYDARATEYAARRERANRPRIEVFIQRLPPKARLLELGTGGGHDAEVFLEAGIDIEPTDGSAALAQEAERRLGRAVRIMRFDQLDAVQVYDGVWANASLLHVPENALADILGRIWRSLKPGGLFFASFKSGDGEDRDTFGRLYNFPSEEKLRADFAKAGRWSEFAIEAAEGGGWDGVARIWLFCTAMKEKVRP